MIRDQETLNLLLDNIARFVRERLVPAENTVAETDAIPPDIVEEMKSLGLFGLTISEEYGGLGLTMEEEVLAMFELGKTSPAFRSSVRSGFRSRSVRRHDAKDPGLVLLCQIRSGKCRRS